MVSMFRPSSIDDETQLVELLKRAFSVKADALFLQRSLLRWKYWEPREGWTGSRSFVIEQEGRIVSHIGIWPVSVQLGAKRVHGIHTMDWAADPDSPGAGVQLLRRLIKAHDFTFSIEGSAMTRQLLPKLGYRVCATAMVFSRPIRRQWRQILEHQRKDAFLPLRLVRDLYSSRSHSRRFTAGWSATELTLTDEKRTEEFTAGRDMKFLRYLQRCPSARFRYFDVFRRSQRVGFFALAVIGKQTLLAGISLADSTVESWRSAFHLVRQTALRRTSSIELIFRTASPIAAEAASQAGMEMQAQTRVHLFQKGEQSTLPLDFQLWDNDDVFLGSY